MFFNLFVINTVAFIHSFALVTQEEVFLVLPELASLQTFFEGGWTLLNKVSICAQSLILSGEPIFAMYWKFRKNLVFQHCEQLGRGDSSIWSVWYHLPLVYSRKPLCQ